MKSYDFDIFETKGKLTHVSNIQYTSDADESEQNYKNRS